MEQGQDKLYIFNMKNIPIFTEIKVKLRKPNPIKEGTSKYGKWYMWLMDVENVTVTSGKGETAEVVKNYTGKVAIFVNDIYNSLFVKFANGKFMTTISIKANAEERETGLQKRYEVKLVKEGTVSEGKLTPSEYDFYNDLKLLHSEGYTITESDAVNISKDVKYNNQIDENKVKEILSKVIGKC